MTGNDADDVEAQLRTALDDERVEDARDLAASLWDEREITDVEVTNSGDAGTVEVSKDGFLGFFSVAVDRRTGMPRADEMGEMGDVIYECDDDRGYHLLEDVKVVVSSKVLDDMNAALDRVKERHIERQSRRREYRNMVLGR